MFDNKKLGGYIQFLRKSCGLTQSMMAQSLGVSPQAVSNWERGESMPDIALLSSIARELGTTVDRILAAAEDFNPDGGSDQEPYYNRPDAGAAAAGSGGQPEPDSPAKDNDEEKPSGDDGCASEFSFEEVGREIKNAVSEILSGLPEQLTSIAPVVKDSVKGALDSIGDVLEDVGTAISEAQGEIREAMEKRKSADGKLFFHLNIAGDERNRQWKDILSIAPYASPEMLDRLVRNLDPVTDHKKIVSIAPFVATKTLDYLVRTYLDANTAIPFELFRDIAPYCDNLDALLMESNLPLSPRQAASVAPFLKQSTVDEVLRRYFEMK